LNAIAHHKHAKKPPSLAATIESFAFISISTTSRMNFKNHYDSLGVPPNVSKNDMKAQYRKLVMKYHPDTSKSKSKATAERFKQISAAYSVLSDDKQRKMYDLELEEFKKFGRIRRPQGGEGGAGPFGRHGASSGMAYRFHVLDGIYKPKNMLIGLTLGFMTVAAAKQMLGVDQEETNMQRNKKIDGKTKLVEAWYNQKKRQWEQPAPWSQSFRDQKPEIKLVPREQVRPASD
jgi:DnaJ-class molecular chaperone